MERGKTEWKRSLGFSYCKSVLQQTFQLKIVEICILIPNRYLSKHAPLYIHTKAYMYRSIQICAMIHITIAPSTIKQINPKEEKG